MTKSYGSNRVMIGHTQVLRGATGFDRIQLLRDAVDALCAADEAKRRDAEQRRAAEEGLSDDELALFVWQRSASGQGLQAA